MSRRSPRFGLSEVYKLHEVGHGKPVGILGLVWEIWGTIFEKERKITLGERVPKDR